METTVGDSVQDWAWLEWVADGVVIIDAVGTMVLANERVCPLLGYKPWELVGRSVDMLLAPGARAGHRRQRSEYAQHPHTREMRGGLDIAALRKDGSSSSLDIHLTPVASGLTVAMLRLRNVPLSAQSQLDELTRRERNARAMLDIVIQRLYGISLTLAAPAGAGSVGVDSSAGMIDATIEMIRRVVLDPAGRDDALAGAQQALLAEHG